MSTSQRCLRGAFIAQILKKIGQFHFFTYLRCLKETGYVAKNTIIINRLHSQTALQTS